MMSSFTFRRVVTEHNVSQDPESLFRDLKSGSSKVQFLWSHQADILRTYMEHKDKSDIALELPTGCGKTLVGLLIGEFRRRSNGERVVYLCPTRQLAYQVGSLAEEYGINCNVFVGPQKDYPQNEYSNYTMGRTIAITTYSGLFNTNLQKYDDLLLVILPRSHPGL
jgi:superfamily II DNA or RNA helicase